VIIEVYACLLHSICPIRQHCCDILCFVSSDMIFLCVFVCLLYLMKDEIPEKSLQRFGAIMNPRVRRLCVVDRVPCPCFIIVDEKMLVMVETQKIEKK